MKLREIVSASTTIKIFLQKFEHVSINLKLWKIHHIPNQAEVISNNLIPDVSQLNRITKQLNYTFSIFNVFFEDDEKRIL